jgi:uncharacterized protein
MTNQNISDEYLNSFVDNQLGSAEKIKAFDTIRRDEKLKDRVCELNSLKSMMQHAYNLPPVYLYAPAKNLRGRTFKFQTLAACLLLLLGGASGWFTHAWSSKGSEHDLAALVQNAQPAAAIVDTRNIIVHVSNSNPLNLKATLDETESLLETYKHAKRQIQIEVIANKRGVDLLRANVSAYQGRINLMQAKYPNLNFLVCGQTINKLHSKGENVQLLPHTGVASSAAQQINMRLNQGWGYVRI